MNNKTARVCYYFVFSVLTVLTTCVSFAAANPEASALLERLQNSSLSFTENKGQFPDHILYQASVPNATLWVTKTGMQYQLTRSVGDIDDQRLVNTDAPTSKLPQFEQLIVATTLRGSNPTPYATAQGLLEGTSNYFLGNDPNKWVTDVPSYSSVVLYNVYPGTDLYYYGANGRIEYDFSLAPGADPSLIQIAYEGVKSLAVAATGDLLIETEWSTITQHKPVVYQEQNGIRIPLDAKYAVTEPNVVTFDLPDTYNPALALVIDPQISYGTYIGHSGTDVGWDIAVDDCNNAYVVGYTNSSSFPTSGGAYQTGIGGSYDVLVAKFNTRDSGSGTRVFATFLGGDSSDVGYGIALDDDGDIYITGDTRSDDYPTTVGAYDTDRGDFANSQRPDAFVTKLDNTGTDLFYSTFIGGAGADYAYGIDVDTNEYAYILGETYIGAATDSFPYVKGFETNTAASLATWEVFLTKLNDDGSDVLYSTMYGGSNGEFPGYGIAVDDDEIAYIEGQSASSDLDMVDSYEDTYDAEWDAFVAVFDTKDSFTASLIYSTFIGGDSNDVALSLTIDDNGFIYVTGSTSSPNFPVVNAYQGSKSGVSDAFLAKIDPTQGASGLLYSTHIGGPGQEVIYDITLDSLDQPLIAGRIDSTGWPSVNAIDGSYNGGGRDIVIAHFEDGNTILFSSYLGDTAYDAAYGIAIDQGQSIYLAAKSTGANLFSSGAILSYDKSINGDSDAVVIKIAPGNNGCQPGDVNNDGVVDRNDIIYLQAYLFSGGPAPDSTSGRVSHSCAAGVTTADLSVLVQYVTSCTPFSCSSCP